MATWDNQLDHLSRDIKQHREEICALRREAAACREEVTALHEYLADAGVLCPATFWAQLHRRRFKAALAAHPLSSEAHLDTALQTYGITLAVGVCAGWGSIRAAGIASKATSRAIASIWPAVRDLCSCRVYVCGGSGDGMEVLDSVECFSVGSQTWTVLPQMLQRRSDASAHVIAGQLFICGGINGEASLNSAKSSVLNSVERYDPLSRKWEAMPSMLFAHRGAASGVIDGKLYVCGGYDAAEEALDLVECFDPKGSANWEALPLMLEPRAEPSAGVVNGRLYVCGGRGGGAWAQLSSVEVLNPKVGGWEGLPPMLEPRSGATSAPVAHRLFVCGGMGNSASVEAFDTKLCVWEAAPPMSVPRYGAAAAAAGGFLCVFGGSHGWQHLDSAEQFSPEKGAWVALPPMSERRMATAVAAFVV